MKTTHVRKYFYTKIADIFRIALTGSVTFYLVQVRLVHFRLVHVRLVQVRLDNILPRHSFPRQHLA